MGERRARSWWGRVGRAVWLRGVGPGVIIVVIGLVFGAVTLLYVRGTAAPTFRVALMFGTINAEWGPPKGHEVAGDWTLGEGYRRRVGDQWAPLEGFRWFLPKKGFPQNWSVSLMPRLSDWRVRVPLVPLGLVWIVVAAGVWWWKGPRPAAWMCEGCRYDLRGVSGGVCPECGRVVEG